MFISSTVWYVYLLPGQQKWQKGQKRISPHPVVYFGPESHTHFYPKEDVKECTTFKLQEPTSSDRKQEYLMYIYIYITCMWISSARRKVKMALGYIFKKLLNIAEQTHNKKTQVSRDTTTFPIRLCRKPPEQTNTTKRPTHQTSYKIKTLMLWYVGSDKNKLPFPWIYYIIIAVVLDTAVHVESAHVVYQDMILCYLVTVSNVQQSYNNKNR